MNAGGFWVDDRHFVPPAAVKSAELKLISYSGSGEYRAGTKLISYGALPDCDTMFESWSNNGWVAPSLPPGEGWWPVISIDVEDGWIEVSGLPVRGGAELVICFYQLLGDRIIGWWVDLETGAMWV